MSVHRRATIAALLTALSLHPIAQAGDVSHLDAITVSATRTATTPFETPQPLTVLEGSAVAARNPQVMAEAFRYEPGAFFQQSGPGQGIVIVRGLKGSEVLHLVDGFRLNNAFFRNSPSQYIALLDPQNISQLELLRGPYATVYGSDAMGGVVQVVTPEERFDGDAWSWRGGTRVHYDSADLARSGRSWAASGDRQLSIAAGVSYGEFGKRRLAEPGQSPDGSGGFSLADRVNDTDYRSRGYDLKTLWSPAAGHELMISVQHFEIPELQRYFQTVPGYSGGAPARAIAQFMNDRAFYHARYRFGGALGFARNLEVHVGHQVMNDDRLDRRQDNSRDEFTFNRSSLSGLTAQAETPLERHRLRYGIEVYRDRVASRAYRESPPGSGNISRPNGTSFFSPFPDGSRADDYGIYALDTWTVNEALSAEGGLRWTRRETTLAKGDRAFGAELADDDFTGNLGLRYALSGQWAWAANIGRGFRSPNLFDLAQVGQRANNRVVVANLDLRPESVTTFDSGLKFRGERLSGEISLFYSDYDDRIVTVNPAFAEGTPQCPDDGDAATTGCAQNQNIAQSRYYGFEGGLRTALTPALSLRTVLNYTWGDQDDGRSKGPANRVPPLNGQVGLAYRAATGWSVEPYLFFAGAQDRLDANDLTDSRIDPNGTPGYAVLNLRAHWPLGPALHLQIDGNNLLDRRYREHGSGIDGAARGLALTVEARFDA
jgi:outer membrane receptor protein involved in Fe transport